MPKLRSHLRRQLSRASVVSRIAHDACLRGPELLGHGLWWEELDRDFATREEPFLLDHLDRSQIEATAAADVVLRTVGACLLGTLSAPTGYHPLALMRGLRERDFYGAFAETADAAAFFASPPKGVAIEKRRARLPLFRPEDGECEDLRFESPFETVSPSQRKSYAANHANRVAHARYWRHHGGPRPTILAVHGFFADFYHLNEWFFAIPWFYRHGYDVLLFTLPFHGRRQERLSPFSGHGFFAGGISRINEALAQAVFDLRVLMDHLEERGVRQIGVTGVSMGGLASALLASVEKRLAFSVPNVPVVSLADVALEWKPIGSLIRLALAATRSDVVALRRWLAPSSPLTYRPCIPHERLMIIGGVGDRLVSPKHSRLLWDHWERCRIHWYPGSHLLHLDRGAYLRQVLRFFHEIGFAR